MGVEPGEVVELPLLHIFQTWQVPKQHILVTPLSWPPKVYIDLYKVYLTIYTVLCCGASVFWIRKKILGKVYCCVRYQPQYQCVSISSDSTCTRRAVLSLFFGCACQHHRTTDCACSAAGLWWGCPVLMDNRESDLESSQLALLFPYSFCNGRMNETRGLQQYGQRELGNKELSWQCLCESSWNEKTNEILGRKRNGTRSSQASSEECEAK